MLSRLLFHRDRFVCDTMMWAMSYTARKIGTYFKRLYCLISFLIICSSERLTGYSFIKILNSHPSYFINDEEVITVRGGDPSFTPNLRDLIQEKKIKVELGEK